MTHAIARAKVTIANEFVIGFSDINKFIKK